MHSGERQNCNSKGKVALDDIALWPNRCTKCHGNTISRFHLIVHYLSGGECSVTPAAFRHNFYPQAINDRPQCTSAQNRNIVAASVPQIWRGCQNFEMMTLVPLTIDPLNPKSDRLRQTVEHYYCATFQVIQIRGLRFIVLTYRPTHPRTHISWSQYPRRRTRPTSSVRIWPESTICPAYESKMNIPVISDTVLNGRKRRHRANVKKITIIKISLKRS